MIPTVHYSGEGEGEATQQKEKEKFVGVICMSNIFSVMLAVDFGVMCSIIFRLTISAMWPMTSLAVVLVEGYIIFAMTIWALVLAITLLISDTFNTRPVEGMFIHLNRPVRNANMSQSSPAMGLTSAAPVNLKLCFYIKFPDKCNLFRNLQTFSFSFSLYVGKRRRRSYPAEAKQ